MSIIYTYRLHQVTGSGMFRSSESYTGSMTKAIQDVIGGWHSERQPRAAIEEGTGRVLYSVDATGEQTEASANLFCVAEAVST